MRLTGGGIKKVIIPKENEKDLKDIPVSISKQIDILPVEHMDEVLSLALVAAPDQQVFQHIDISIDIAGEGAPKETPLI